jgi:hypothetical protein
MLIDTSNMIWSFSRLSAYETCPYLFYKLYIDKIEREDNFFSQYGSFIHEILEKFYLGIYDTWELRSVYEEEYRDNIKKDAPPNSFVDLGSSYYDAGIRYLSSFEPQAGMKVLGVEKEYTCNIKGHPFKMIVDLILEDKNGNIIIQDHKSKSIKSANEAGAKPYWKQMSLYAIPVFEKYGRYPTELQINAFKANKIFTKKFDPSMIEDASDWCLDIIHKIESEDCWDKKPDQFFCDFLCDLRNTCDKKEGTCS